MRKKIADTVSRFTLIELMITIAIFGMIAAVLVPTLMPQKADAAELGNPSKVISQLQVIGQTATNHVVVLEFPRSATAGIQIETRSGAANTSNLIVNIDTKIGNGTNWVTGLTAITNVAAGTAVVPSATSLSIGARQWLRLSITNEAAGTVTNFVDVYVGSKDGL